MSTHVFPGIAHRGVRSGVPQTLGHYTSIDFSICFSYFIKTKIFSKQLVTSEEWLPNHLWMCVMGQH